MSKDGERDPNATIQLDALGDLENVDLSDPDVSAQSDRPPPVRGTRPPPLPPTASVPPPAPVAAAPAPSSGPPFLVIGIVLFVLLGAGLGVGAVVARSSRQPPPQVVSASAPTQTAAVIAIPTVEFNDETDAGP